MKQPASNPALESVMPKNLLLALQSEIAEAGTVGELVDVLRFVDGLLRRLERKTPARKRKAKPEAKPEKKSEAKPKGEKPESALCAVIGCESDARAQGYCANHYQKLLRLEKRGGEHGWGRYAKPQSVEDIVLKRGRRPAQEVVGFED